MGQSPVTQLLGDALCYGITDLAWLAHAECPVESIMGIWNTEQVTEGGALWGAICSTNTMSFNSPNNQVVAMLHCTAEE